MAYHASSRARPERFDPDGHPGRVGRPPLRATDALAVLQPLNGFTTYQSQTGAVGGIGLGGGAATITATIQLPNTTMNTISTTVTVPDGGTVLLGGVKSLTEQRNRVRRPGPVQDRRSSIVCSATSGSAGNSQSLMLMVTPRIIILEEEEERLGIPSVAL